MILKKTVHYTQEKIDRIICDMCGASTRRGKQWDIPGSTDTYRWAETCLDYTESARYPDNGEREDEGIWSVDICPTCMRTKVFPWLESQGVTIQHPVP